jgi:hypothetical protein
MANENQQQKNLQETAESLKVAQATQNRLNAEFKESVNLLTKMNNLITDSASKTSSFEKSTINVRKLQTEQERIERRRKNLIDQITQANQTEVQNAKDYIKNIEDRRKKEEEIFKQRSLGNYQQATALNEQLALIQQSIDLQETRLNQEQLSLIAAIQSERALEERLGLLGQEIKSEKDIEKQLGNTGKALKLLNKYLLFGKDTYSKMVTEAREGEDGTKKWVARVAILSAGVYGAYKAISAFVSAAKDGLDSLTGTGGPINKFFSPFTGLVKQIPFIGGFLGGLIDTFLNLADLAASSSSNIQKFGRNLGYSLEESIAINNQFVQLKENFNDTLYNSEKLRKSQTELSEALSVNSIFSGQILRDNIKLAELAGLDLETRKQLALVTQVSGQSQLEIYGTLVGQNNALKQSLGINLRVQDAIKQASSYGGYLGLTFAKYPTQLTKSLMAVKAMGLELKQLDGIADSLLDFESSISKEFEAQLMTGKDINLTKAREAFLNNNLEKAAAEITKQVGTSAEYLEMNRFAAQSLAATFGMSRDELADMLKQQEFFSALGVKDLKTYQQRVVELNKTIAGQDELNKKLGEEEVQRVLNQTATEKIANFMDKIKQSFADLLANSTFKDFINKVVDFLSKPENMQSIINSLTNFVSLLIRSLAYIVDAADIVTRVLSVGILDIPNSIPDSLHKIADDIGAQKITGMTNNPTPVDVGTTASSSQVKSTSFATGGPAMAQQGNITNVINVPRPVIEDHTTSLAARLERSPERDISTGYIA